MDNLINFIIKVVPQGKVSKFPESFRNSRNLKTEKEEDSYWEASGTFRNFEPGREERPTLCIIQYLWLYSP